jgi:hypothetical protein
MAEGPPVVGDGGHRRGKALPILRGKAAAASMIGVVGKQNSVETPSRFRIWVIAAMTSIGVLPCGGWRLSKPWRWRDDRASAEKHNGR